jgi:hypothetical protein
LEKGLAVYTAINEITAELAREGISKDRVNSAQNYRFRGVDDVYAALASKLAEHKLCILPRVLKRESVDKTMRSGAVMIYTFVDVAFDFVSAIDGSPHPVVRAGEASDSGDKSCKKALSAAYSYTCFETFCIPTEGDNDSEDNKDEGVTVIQPTPKVPLTIDGNTEAHNTLRKALAFYCGDDQAKQKEVLTQITAYTGKSGDFHAGVDSVDQISTALAGLAIKTLESLSKTKDPPVGNTSGWGGLEGDPSVLPEAPKAPITKQALLDWLAADNGECKQPKNFVLANISKLPAEDQKGVTTALINRRRELSAKK